MSASAQSHSGQMVRAVGLTSAVGLIVGNMVGTSIYTLPASLAEAAGPVSIFAWLITALGYLFIALVYARLGPLFPRTGGPYHYAREAFGDYAGFLSTWAYWFSATVGNAAIALGVVGYLEGLLPEGFGGGWRTFALAQLCLWSLTLLNILGVRESTRLQTFLMFANVIPLLGITALAAGAFDASNLQPFAPKGFSSLPAACALIVWAYSGIESATVPAEEMKDAERTIRRSTMIGYAVGTVVFLATAIVTAGVVPNAELAVSERPLALMAERGVGDWAGTWIAWAAAIAGLATLNGWILMAGRIPVGAAQDGLFFARLGRVHPRLGTPVTGLLVGSGVASLALLLALHESLLDAFNSIVALAVLTTLLPHLFAAAAQLHLARVQPGRIPPAQRRRAAVVALLAFAAVLFFMYGCGPEIALWGFLVIFAGTPIYVWLRTPGSGSRIL
ncbi:MAG: hypothetical protein RL277_758 [Planctomycetota bacterium]